mmetsp:Transcript_16542/g.53861  ORF Transcript_16542/g.53861 Transcript_16542/m.53861 type:complete len:286 (+) Transcript_16542:682-1539(+)
MVLMRGWSRCGEFKARTMAVMLSLEPDAWAASMRALAGFCCPAASWTICTTAWSSRFSKTPSEARTRKRSSPLRWMVAVSGVAMTSWGLAYLRGRAPTQRVRVMPPGQTRFGLFLWVEKATAEPTTLPKNFLAEPARASETERATLPPASLMRFSSRASPALWSRVKQCAFRGAASSSDPPRAKTALESPSQATSRASSFKDARTTAHASGQFPPLRAASSVAFSVASIHARKSSSFSTRVFMRSRANSDARFPPQPSKTAATTPSSRGTTKCASSIVGRPPWAS